MRLANDRSAAALSDAIAGLKAVPDSTLAPLAEAVADSAAHSESLLRASRWRWPTRPASRPPSWPRCAAGSTASTQAPTPERSDLVLARLGLASDQTAPAPPVQPEPPAQGVRISLRDQDSVLRSSLADAD